jgi:hypothetical protein
MKRSDSDLNFDDRGDVPPLLAEGDHYVVSFVRPEKAWLGKYRQKIYLYFEIVEPQQHRGDVLWMACNYPEKGRFGPSSKFWLQWVIAGGRRPMRADRLSTKVFRAKYFRARMRTVTRTTTQEARTPAQCYSVIDTLLEVVAGSLNDSSQASSPRPLPSLRPPPQPVPPQAARVDRSSEDLRP